VRAKPRILVLSSCTSVKAGDAVESLTPADFARGPSHILARHDSDLADSLLSAEELYRGQQHVRLMRGVEVARAAEAVEVDLRIVSAGYGVLRASDRVAPYECTFQGMRRAARGAWARRLDIPDVVRRTLSESFALGIILLGDEYLSVCQLDDTLVLGGPTLFFCGSRAALRLPPLPGLQPCALGTRHARAFSCGLVGLKGEVGGRLLAYLAEQPGRIDRLETDVLVDQLRRFGPVAPARTSTTPALF
jgi:hypothetical protein